MTLLLLAFLVLTFVAAALAIFGWNTHHSWRLHLATAACTWAIAVVSFAAYLIPSEHARWASVLVFVMGYGWLVASIMHFVRFRQARKLTLRAE